MRSRTRPELPYLLMGAAGLVALTFLLPLADAPELPRAARIAAYALVLAPVALLLHGFLLAARSYPTSRLLILGAAAGASGVLFALIARPEDLENGSGLCSRCHSPTSSGSSPPRAPASRSRATLAPWAWSCS